MTVTVPLKSSPHTSPAPLTASAFIYPVLSLRSAPLRYSQGTVGVSANDMKRKLI